MRTEIVVSFDTTGSMRPCIAQVRANVDKFCEDLFRDIVDLRIGLIAHGDYWDKEFCISILPLTEDANEIKEFIRNTPNTSGGDPDECYELVLHKAQSFNWTQESNKILVLIGDAFPHEVNYSDNTLRLDWQEEAIYLKKMGVRVYPLKCLSWGSESFWSKIAEIHETPLIKLENFSAATEVIMGYAYASAGEDAFRKYEEQLVPGGEAHSNVEVLRSEMAKFG